MRAGCDPASFWDYTPREGLIIAKGRFAARRDEHNARVSAAWWTAFWPNMKSPPALEKLLLPEDRPTRHRQSWQEMKAHLMLALGSGKPKEP